MAETGEEIRVGELDPKFKYEIASMPGAENFKRCFTCGTCTASCPVAEVNEEYDPRKIIRMAILGMKDQVLGSDTIWMCSRCYTCFARCPQNVKFTEVMVVLREMAVKAGAVPDSTIEDVREVDRFVQELRCDLISNLLSPSEEKAGRIREKLESELEENASED